MYKSTKETTPLLRDSSQADVSIPLTNLSSISTDTHAAAKNQTERNVSLDQYRGFVILWSIIVPLVGDQKEGPVHFKHNLNFFSFADEKNLRICIDQYLDSIMPQFYLAVGFSMQLTLTRLRAKKGIREVLIKQLRRSRTLYIIGLLYHGVGLPKEWTNLGTNWSQLLLLPIWNKILFQTLTIIAVTQLIILPTITRPVWVRVCYMIGLIVVYLVGQWTYFFSLQRSEVIDGGSFGAFSWVLVMIGGTFLHDWNEWIHKVPVRNFIARRRRVIIACVELAMTAGIILVLGYLVSSIPASWSPICFTKDREIIVCPNISLPSIPFVPPEVDVISMWTMSQLQASISIQLAGSIRF